MNNGQNWQWMQAQTVTTADFVPTTAQAPVFIPASPPIRQLDAIAHPVIGAHVTCPKRGACSPQCLACILRTSEATGAWLERQRIGAWLRARGKPNLAAKIERGDGIED